MCQITTDKETVTSFFTDEKQMSYEAVSTGYAVISDPNYKVQVFEYNINDMAGLLNVTPASGDDGKLLGDDQRASFGAFPYIGEITAVVSVFSFVTNTVLGDSADMDAIIKNLGTMADGDWDDEDSGGGDVNVGGEGGVGNGTNSGNSGNAGSDGGSSSGSTNGSSGGSESTSNDSRRQNGGWKGVTLSVLVKFDETYYGGVRFMLGAIVSYGGGKGYKNRKNPFRNANSFRAAAGDFFSGFGSEGDGGVADQINTNPGFFAGQGVSSFGGPHFQLRAYLGVYYDFGWVELKEKDANGNPQKSHDAVFMGTGGFIGFGASAGYAWYLMIVVVPAYVNVEAGFDLSIFLGTTADPNKTLDSYQKYDDFLNSDKIGGEDFTFNFDFKGRIYASLTFGVGLYKVLGVRITGEVVFEFGYSNKVCDWYPKLFDTGWGYVMEAGFTGTIDLLVTSIDVYSAFWPLPVGSGYLRYFQEVRRANKCISYVETGIKNKHGSQADRDTAYQMCRDLEQFVDSQPPPTGRTSRKGPPP